MSVCNTIVGIVKHSFQIHLVLVGGCTRVGVSCTEPGSGGPGVFFHDVLGPLDASVPEGNGRKSPGAMGGVEKCCSNSGQLPEGAEMRGDRRVRTQAGVGYEGGLCVLIKVWPAAVVCWGC
ncbi:hypothetical protein Salat_1463000 [Sesamum alatum]|uniref:Uncharacterized protein n=1 Tax=Sesamum alatum TaxID=300844 RepID=A0AAE1YBI2_9LAMI|nr:hypothetical protein Salat_1463000 [Sesamum alatum]